MRVATTAIAMSTVGRTKSDRMETFHDCRSLARRLLTDAVLELEASLCRNTATLRSVGGACRLLGFDSLANRCGAILESLPDSVFFAGAIANFPLPERAPAGSRQLAPLDELKADHPPLTDETARDYITKYCASENHLRLAAERDYDAAFAAATSELQTEDCAAAQAVLGDIEAALKSASNVVTPDSRADHVRFICTIEMFRRELFDDGNRMLSSLFPSQIGPDAAAQLALGANGFLPWLGYPFADW